MFDASLTFHDLTLGYHRHPAVHHLGGTLRQGSLTALVGPNGSGKSTLMKGIVGVIDPISGHVDRSPGLEARLSAAAIRTRPRLPGAGARPGGAWPFADGAACSAAMAGPTAPRSSDAIAAVGLRGFEKRALDTLSGGQLQRALFARVIVQDAPLILLDEPFNAVDAKTSGDLIAIIQRWHREGRTVLVVVHDLDLVRRHFPETLLLARRAVAWGPTPAALTPQNLDRARHFNEAWADDAPWCEAEPGDRRRRAVCPGAQP